MFDVPLMPFRGIVLQHRAYGLCLPGLGLVAYGTCGCKLCNIQDTCMPYDELENADNI